MNIMRRSSRKQAGQKRIRPLTLSSSCKIVVSPGENEIDKDTLYELLCEIQNRRLPENRKVFVNYLRRNPHVDHCGDRPDLRSPDEAEIHYCQPVVVKVDTLRRWYRELNKTEFGTEEDDKRMYFESEIDRKRAAFPAAMQLFMHMHVPGQWGRKRPNQKRYLKL